MHRESRFGDAPVDASLHRGRMGRPLSVTCRILVPASSGSGWPRDSHGHRDERANPYREPMPRPSDTSGQQMPRLTQPIYPFIPKSFGGDSEIDDARDHPGKAAPGQARSGFRPHHSKPTHQADRTARIPRRGFTPRHFPLRYHMFESLSPITMITTPRPKRLRSLQHRKRLTCPSDLHRLGRSTDGQMSWPAQTPIGLFARTTFLIRRAD
jgi:hypothetical protein